jgi:hypothetical protein
MGRGGDGLSIHKCDCVRPLRLLLIDAAIYTAMRPLPSCSAKPGPSIALLKGASVSVRRILYENGPLMMRASKVRECAPETAKVLRTDVGVSCSNDCPAML